MKKILILGATSAIAKATARQWAAEGHSFFLVGRNKEKLEALENDLKARGAYQTASETCDLIDYSRHFALIENADHAIGNVDTVLVAHGELGRQADLQQSSEESMRSFHTNFLSVVSLLTIIANKFEKLKNGTLVVISSVAGERGRQSNYIYGSAKGGLSIFLQGLRNRLYPAGVNVITIKPGFVDTPMTREFPKGPLWASPETIAKGIVQAVEKKQDEVYLPWFWHWIMMIIRSIPERLFKKLKL
jgi:short-subunit dehydrogenase